MYTAMMSNMAHDIDSLQGKKTSKPHPFSIAGILGQSPAKVDQATAQHVVAEQIMPVPLQSSTPVPSEELIKHDIKTPKLPTEIENINRVEKWVLESCVSNNHSPESTRRDILAESFALALGRENGQSTSSIEKSTHNIQEEESSSGYIGSDNNSAGSQEILHDQSFTSESTSRPGSPDSERRRAKKARTSFTASQLCDLETHYRTQRYISAADRIKLARKLKLSDQQVKTWYQNRRMKEKRQVQDFEHAKKFHQTGAMLAAAAAGGAHPLVGTPYQTIPGLQTTISTPMLPHQPVISSYQQVPTPSDYYGQPQMSFSQLLNGPSPPHSGPASRIGIPTVAPVYAHQSGPVSTLAQISALPIPSSNDVRSIAGQYHPVQFGSGLPLAPGHISAFTRIGQSITPMSIPSHVITSGRI